MSAISATIVVVAYFSIIVPNFHSKFKGGQIHVPGELFNLRICRPIAS